MGFKARVTSLFSTGERLARVKDEPKPKPDIREFVYKRARRLPVQDGRTSDEIIGYGPDGLFL